MLLGRTWVNNHSHVLRAVEAITTNKFILHYLNQFDYQGYVNGGTRLKLTQTNMKRIPVPLPPLAEQQQIAAKLDELLAQVDTLKTRLDTIPKILKRFRQSVLAAAVSRKLTEGLYGSNNFKKVTLEILCQNDRVITYGVIKLGNEVFDGIPCLRTSNVRWLAIETNSINIKRIASSISEQYSRTVLQGGEVLVNVRGTLVGVAVVQPQMQGWNISREVAVVPIDNNKANSEFISFWIASDHSQRWLRSVEKGVAYIGINLEDLCTLPVELPSLEEQTEIVRRVEQLFTYADQIEQRVKDAQAKVNHLTQAKLAKAFRGELTSD